MALIAVINGFVVEVCSAVLFSCEHCLALVMPHRAVKLHWIADSCLRLFA